MHAELVPLDGGKPIVLDRDVSVVGRKSGVCDVIVDRESVSKLHCLIVKTDGLLFVRDLGSTNGTKVNGQKVIRGALLPGDELSFAGAKHTVVLGPARKTDSSSPKKSELKPAFADVTTESNTTA
ncbi:MAG: FHA domain-containing protein [Planctomycetota bacterium]|nr:FHA domain-containing protein [Planctomycetaceae bacterium]MDQ3331169.1 FHA domain-containing protein [Planctomycetota bacterium]